MTGTFVVGSRFKDGLRASRIGLLADSSLMGAGTRTLGLIGSLRRGGSLSLWKWFLTGLGGGASTNFE